MTSITCVMCVQCQAIVYINSLSSLWTILLKTISEHTDRTTYSWNGSFQNHPNTLEIVITWCYRKPFHIIFPPCKVSISCCWCIVNIDVNKLPSQSPVQCQPSWPFELLHKNNNKTSMFIFPWHLRSVYIKIFVQINTSLFCIYLLHSQYRE